MGTDGKEYILASGVLGAALESDDSESPALRPWIWRPRPPATLTGDETIRLVGDETIRLVRLGSACIALNTPRTAADPPPLRVGSGELVFRGVELPDEAVARRGMVGIGLVDDARYCETSPADAEPAECRRAADLDDLARGAGTGEVGSA